jgi:hypothetical protein
MRDAPAALSAAEFQSLFDGLRRGVPWGSGDRRGALNYLTPERVTAAAREIRTGRTISMEAPIGSERTADNPDPCVHRMINPADGDGLSPDGLDFAMDGVSLHVHGNADSHIDALCHVSYDGLLYNDVAAGSVTTEGAAELSIAAAAKGIAGRGVLLDIPRLSGADWLEPGEHVTAGDLAAAEDAQQVRVGPGDLLFVRVGHRRRRCWAVTPTTTPAPAAPKASAFRCMCWRSARWASTCWTTCSSMTWSPSAKRPAAGRSSA